MTFDWDGFDAGHPRLERGDLRTNDFIELHGDALLDLHERVMGIESQYQETSRGADHNARVAMQKMATIKDVLAEHVRLQKSVDAFAHWLIACKNNWNKNSSGWTQAWASLRELERLGLIEAGGTGGAAHPDPDSPSEEQP